MTVEEFKQWLRETLRMSGGKWLDREMDQVIEFPCPDKDWNQDLSRMIVYIDIVQTAFCELHDTSIPDDIHLEEDEASMYAPSIASLTEMYLERYGECQIESWDKLIAIMNDVYNERQW